MGIAGSCSNQGPDHYQAANEGTKRFSPLIMRGIHGGTITTDPSYKYHSEYMLNTFDIFNLYLPILK